MFFADWLRNSLSETIRVGNRLVPEMGSLGLATNWHRIGWIDIGLPLDWQLTETRLAAY